MSKRRHDTQDIATAIRWSLAGRENVYLDGVAFSAHRPDDAKPEAARAATDGQGPGQAPKR